MNTKGVQRQHHTMLFTHLPKEYQKLALFGPAAALISNPPGKRDPPCPLFSQI